MNDEMYENTVVLGEEIEKYEIYICNIKKEKWERVASCYDAEYAIKLANEQMKKGHTVRIKKISFLIW